MAANGNNPYKGGIPGGVYKPLDGEDVRRIHNASMRVFERTGIRVMSRRAREEFRRAGADVDEKTCTVRAPEEWVLKKLSTAPACVTLCGREERHDLALGGSRVYIGTGGTALNTLDIDTGERRPAKLLDVQRSARLVDALENIHFYVLSCYPHDVPKQHVDVNRFYAGIRNTAKHVMGGIYTSEGVRNVAKMAAEIAGSREALLRRPFVSFITCIISPLRMDGHYTDLMIDAIETGLPVATPAAPMAGATSPATLAGTLVQMNVEALSGVLLSQLIHPGHPVLYSCVPATMDLRTSAFCFGSIEMALMNAACAQLASFYQLPCYATAGVNDSKVPDIQSGYEGMASALMCALSGCNFIHDAAGLIESGLTISYEQYVVDNDIAGMCMRAVGGIGVNDEALAADVIAGAGADGHYLTHEHTLRHMRSEFFYPTASDRRTYARWAGDGGMDGRERARRMAMEILASHKPIEVDAAVEKRIVTEIPGMQKEWLD